MLPQMERDKLVAEWCRLVGREVSAQVAQKPQGGRPKGGESEAARQLGLDRGDVRRAIKVASITPEAQQAAHEVGNRWATKSKQLLASASPWVQLVDSWWTAGGHLVDKPYSCPAKGQAMNSGQIREAVEAIQWQSDGLLQVLYNAVGLEDDKLRTLSAGLSLIALAAGQVHKALAPENSPQ